MKYISEQCMREDTIQIFSKYLFLNLDHLIAIYK